MSGGQLLSLAPLALTALAVVVAMVLAPLARMRTVKLATAVVMALAAALLLWRVGDAPMPAYALLKDDGLARLGGLLSILSGLAILAFVREEDGAKEGPALVAAATAGAVAVCAAAHAGVLFLGLEITTIALIAYAVLPRTAEAVEAGYKVFLMAGVAAASLLLGIAFLFGSTGSLMLADWTGAPDRSWPGAILLFVALAFKFSLVPFHMWTPDLFSGTRPVAAAIAGALSKLAVGIALLRLAVDGGAGVLWSPGLLLAGASAVLLGNLVALRQTNLLRLLGYSSIGHSGYVAMLLSDVVSLSAEAAVIYLLAYLPAILVALFVAAGMRHPQVEGLRGLIRRRPLEGVAMALALLSLAGLPPTVGFLGKVYLFSSLAAAGAWTALVVALIGAALGFFYYMRAVILALAAPQDPEPSPAQETHPTSSQAVILLALCALLVLAGIYPEPLLRLVDATLTPALALAPG
jgi:NADH-quinone oxidoreductase subunit N